MLSRRAAQELDNWITGHYGEDQFRGPITCPKCEVVFEKYGDFEEHECPCEEEE